MKDVRIPCVLHERRKTASLKDVRILDDLHARRRILKKLKKGEEYIQEQDFKTSIVQNIMLDQILLMKSIVL